MELQRTSEPVPFTFPPFGISVLESHHSSTFMMDWTIHPFHKVLYVSHGAGQLLARNQSFPLLRGTLVFVPPFVEHRLVDAADQAVSLFALCIRADQQTEPVAQVLSTMRTVTCRAVSPASGALERQLRNILFEQSARHQGWEMMLIGETYELLTWVMRNSRTRDQVPDTARSRVAAVTRQLTETFYQEQTLAAAAEAADLSERRFSQLFRELNGTSWLQYLRKLRIRHSCRLLESTDHSITAISFECGFEDLSTFYRSFRAETAMTPGEWKARTQSAAAPR